VLAHEARCGLALLVGSFLGKLFRHMMADQLAQPVEPGRFAFAKSSDDIQNLTNLSRRQGARHSGGDSQLVVVVGRLCDAPWL